MKNKNDSPYLQWDKKQIEPDLNPQGLLQTNQIVSIRPLFFAAPEINLSELSMDREINCSNRFFRGDNLEFIRILLQEGYQEKIKLIYIDPPYFSQSNFQSEITSDAGQKVTRAAFDDHWSGDISQYLNMLYPRLLLMRRLLMDEGSIFVHVDWHCSHYVRIILDEIFGRDNFINEIVWCYSGGSRSKRNFLRKHDIIFWYGKTKGYSFNPQYRPYSAGTLQRGLTKVKGSQYKLRPEGAAMQDWWSDIGKILSPSARENLKYPTQKPEALMRRIISAASDPGDLVADFFGGSGTSAQVSDELGRSWLLCDSGNLATHILLYRMIRSGSQAFSIESLTNSILPTSDNLKIETNVELINDQKVHVSISIVACTFADIKSEPLKGSELNAYIEFWELDLNYDQKVFHSDYQIIRSTSQFKGQIPIEVGLLVNKNRVYNLGIKMHDIWAREHTTSIIISL